MIRASVLGATGYSGGELLRILLRHGGVAVQHLTSESNAGKPVGEFHPDLRNRIDHRFEKPDVRAIARDSDVVFACLPHAVGIPLVARVAGAGVKVIDLSADFRLRDPRVYRTWYKVPHTAQALLKKAVYGLPELFRESIKAAPLIANPGCYASAAILAAAPLVRARLVDPTSLIVDAKSGVSGAGRKVSPSFIYCEVNENVQAYGVASHRHQPEIESILSSVSSRSVRMTFTPHLIPMNRGILSVLYGSLKRSTTTERLRRVYTDAYAGEPFVRVLPEGVLPQTKHVTNTNYCDIGVFQDVRARRVIIVSALDNLVKGAAGQAVQNMNIAFNRPETEGLR